MVDILCGQVGVTVRLFVVMVFQEGVVSAKIPSPAGPNAKGYSHLGPS